MKEHLLMEEEGHGCELSGLQTTVLGSSAGEDGGELANESTGSPLLAGRVEEGRNLGRSTTVSGRESKDEAIVLGHKIASDFGDVRAGNSILLLEDLLGEGLGDLVDVDVSASLLGTLSDSLGHPA